MNCFLDFEATAGYENLFTGMNASMNLTVRNRSGNTRRGAEGATNHFL
jgi:hypothetical protein